MERMVENPSVMCHSGPRKGHPQELHISLPTWSPMGTGNQVSLSCPPPTCWIKWWRHPVSFLVTYHYIRSF